MTKKQTIARRVLPGLLGCTTLALSAGIALAEPTGTITASSPYPTQSLNPTGSTSADLGTALASKALFDTLLIRKGDQFIPSLATEWSANEDGTAYTFKLRDDVTFHDGSPLTAKDVAASIKLSSETPGPLAALWKPVSAEVVDDFTVTLNLERPMGALLSNLSTLEILPADLMGNEDYWNAPIGSGPFKYNAFNPGQELRLDAYEDYWDGVPKAAHLVLRVIPEISSRLAALETGEIDATWNVPDDLLPELEGNSDLSIEMVPSLSSYVLWFNPSEGPLSDVRVRQAMWHAVDVEKLVSVLHPSSGKVAKAAITPEVFGYAPQTPYDYDPEKAKALLAEAGYPDGIDTSVQFSKPEFRAFVDALISEWDKVGIRVKSDEKEHAVWLDDLLKLNWNMNFMAQGASTGDADFLLGRLYTCAAERIGYCSEDLDALLTKAGASSDPEERLELYDQAQQHIYENAVGIYPMDLQISYVWRDRLDGFVPDPNFVPDFKNVSVKD